MFERRLKRVCVFFATTSVFLGAGCQGEINTADGDSGAGGDLVDVAVVGDVAVVDDATIQPDEDGGQSLADTGAVDSGTDDTGVPDDRTVIVLKDLRAFQRQKGLARGQRVGGVGRLFM